MAWFQGRDMHRCRACGYLFAYRWASERYCSSADCQTTKKRGRPKPQQHQQRESRTEQRGQGPWAGVRAAERDAKAALAELRAWIAQERATW
jgi:hypothetical protein